MTPFHIGISDINGHFLSFVKFQAHPYVEFVERKSMVRFVKRNLWIGMLWLFAAMLAIDALTQ
jgi:hypothetical protein